MDKYDFSRIRGPATFSDRLGRVCCDNVPSPLCGRPGVVERVEVVGRHELADLVHPVAGEGGRTHHDGRQRPAVCRATRLGQGDT